MRVNMKPCDSACKEAPDFPLASPERYRNVTAAAATQCRSNPVSSRRLLETGIFQVFAGDYRRFFPESGQIGILETTSGIANAREWRAFLPLLGSVSPRAGLVGWRRSADRTHLHANSLL